MGVCSWLTKTNAYIYKKTYKNKCDKLLRLYSHSASDELPCSSSLSCIPHYINSYTKASYKNECLSTCISNLHTCDYCTYYALHWHFQSCEWMDCHMLVGCSSDCSVRGPGFESHHRWLHFITTATAIYSLRYGLHTFTAVPRSIQPSTLREMVKWVSAYGLSNYNNGNGGCGR